MTTTTLKRVLRYVSHFGLSAGLQAARLHVRPQSVVRIKLPGIEHPIWARAGTSDVETFEEVFVARQYDLPFADFKPRHILDLGANVGYASVYFAARWPLARILAIEPSGKNLAFLERNTRAWNCITPLQAAVWSHSTVVRIANPGDEANAYRMSEAAAAQPEGIPAYTVDELIARLGCERLDLLKMDVEGAESEIFKNRTGWLDRINVMMIELHDRIVPECARVLYDALRGRRFRQEIVGGNLAIDFR
ncbi:MAG TPA: FkbM family methyltransferase [Opitutaceae bacterium]|nr:FkbM family methyltransferase [Opitutaceae bacterium]